MQAKDASGTVVPDDLVLVAYVSSAYGLAGWIRLRPYSAEASALLHAKTWWMDKPAVQDVSVMEVRTQGEDIVARLMGVADRVSAENLRGATVQIRRSHFPPLADNEFYWVDLIGHEVENLQGVSLGVVVGLMDNGAHPILRVADLPNADQKKPEELLIPFVDRFVSNVDQTAKRITVDWDRDYQ